MSNQYGLLFRFCRLLLRLVYPRYKIDKQLPSGPVVYISHHQNLFGPFILLLWYPKFFRTWILNVFFDQKECFKQYVEYTFTKRFSMPKLLAQILAYPISWFIAQLITSSRGIPVYRGSRKILETMNLSVKAIKSGESIAIFPNVDYSNSINEDSDFYEGFLYLEKYFYKETKEHITFIPLHVSKKARRIVHGKPIQYLGTSSKGDIVHRIKEEINNLASTCGDLR